MGCKRRSGTHLAASGVQRPHAKNFTPRIYAMNMRAAEAMVSNAPKAMKIFPISEV